MAISDVQQREAAINFANYWRNKGNEKSDSQRFWIDFVQDVLGINNATQKIKFEKPVIVNGKTKFIDVYIPETNTLIEQKSLGISLDKPEKQSDGAILTPFEQGRRYCQWLPHEENARWIITCNFGSFEIYDMNKPQDAPVIVELDEIRHKLSLFDFMFKKEVKELSHEMEISVKAGEIVGILYDKLLVQYKDPENEESLKSLNALCVRLVFCLYAEDACIFDSNNRSMFRDYLQDVEVTAFRKTLVEFFKVLDTKEENRDRYLAEDNPKLAAFPYVNGGLFADEDIEIPPFTEEIKTLLLEKASADFDWSEISPTIFGAVFESTLNPETRRSGGMHYTSIENIHKVIDPLFFEELNKEYTEIIGIDVAKNRNKRLDTFQEKLAGLTFLDPACGSGNFLTETYISLRTLENKVIFAQRNGQMEIGTEEYNPIKVSIKQFYGIEINDFAVTVAKTALWIAESQMLKKTEDILLMHLDFLPLKSYANIREADSIDTSWNDIVAPNNISYIMGNPPFIGARMMEQGSKQKLQVEKTFGDIKDVQDLDYVTCWFKLAAQYIRNTSIKVGFVSTNSICQGSQVPILWGVLLNEFKVKIIFAHQTFKWNSDSSDIAAVHCVIVGFSTKNQGEKYLFTYKRVTDEPLRIKVDNINPYLIEGEDLFVNAQKNALCDVPKMNFGNQPRDGGFFILSDDEYSELIKRNPNIEKWIHPYVGADEFIKGKKRWCIWLKNASPADIQGNKELYKRVCAVRDFRLASKAKTTNGYAKVPHLFAQLTQPDGSDWLCIPSVSSERRRYVPIGFLPGTTISSNAVQIVPGANLYQFGILTSNVHMAWMRTVAGRLKSDYRYSKELVYNTFPWPEISDAKKEKISETAREIITVREKYSDCSMAFLYDPNTMPRELSRAHEKNDMAVMQAYGFHVKTESGKMRWLTEIETVAALMKMYQKLTEE